jgi:catechol 2,3-dioxygenase-like lactoylglutathione lyase family enzyme
MRIGLTSIFVDDQDQAERFYTLMLGLQVKTSAPYGPEERWLSVVSPEEPDGVELVLHLTDEPARAFQQASGQLGRPVLSLRTDDCVGEAERLKAKGVVFVKEPWRRDYLTDSTTTVPAHRWVAVGHRGDGRNAAGVERSTQ